MMHDREKNLNIYTPKILTANLEVSENLTPVKKLK
jgi:hypothetical protein